MILTETPRRQKITKLVSWGHWFCLCNIFIAIVISGIYLFSSSLPDTALGLLYLFTNWFSHIGFLTFIGFVILVLPLCYLIPSSHAVRAWGSVVAALGLAFLAFDALLYTQYGLHITLSSADLVKQQTFHVISEFDWRKWVFLFVLFLIWLLFQLTLANSIFKRLERFQQLRFAPAITVVFISFFVFSHVVHIWADAKLYEPIIKQDDLFPLSYPATAKTMMSKYGLFNLEDYQNRKQLKFDRMFDSVRYPKEAVYCSVDQQQRTVLLFSTQGVVELEQTLSLKPLAQHLDTSLDVASGISEVLYGLPDLYHREIDKRSPLLVEIPQSLGVPVHIHSDVENQARWFEDNISWAAFSENMVNQEYGLFIAFTDAKNIQQIMSTLRPSDKVLVSQMLPDQATQTYSNFISAASSVSSHQDIAATTLGAMDCLISHDQHSTGRDLNRSNRRWIVSSQADKILVIHDGLRAEVDRNGNYQMYSLTGERLNNETLDIALLGQAIKLVSSFAGEQ